MMSEVAKRSRQTSKRAQVLQAAKAVFSEGFGVASMDLIADRAAVSKATVYAYFDSKEQLFEAVVADYCREQQEAMEALEAEHPSVEEGLLRMAEIMIRYWADPGALRFSRMIMGETARFPELGRAFVRSGFQQLQKVVADFLAASTKRGELHVKDPQLVAELFIGMMRGAVQMRSLMALGQPPAPAPLKQLAREAVKIVLAAYK